jgi:hypothetical protein
MMSLPISHAKISQTLGDVSLRPKPTYINGGFEIFAYG